MLSLLLLLYLDVIMSEHNPSIHPHPILVASTSGEATSAHTDHNDRLKAFAEFAAKSVNAGPKQ